MGSAATVRNGLGQFVKQDIDQRFWAKVDASGDCWEWTGNRLPGGYGLIAIDRKSWLAHRWAYTRLVGPIPADLTIDHLCRVRHCVNPDHLEPVTMRENHLRGNGFVGRNHRKTRCNSGHLLSERNVYVAASGSRQCRTCHAARQREYRRRNP